MWDHSVTFHDTSEHNRLTPATQVGIRFTYPGGMEGWVDLLPKTIIDKDNDVRSLATVTLCLVGTTVSVV